MRKILIDVGGHLGETVAPALDPKYGFDAIYSLEPVRSCCQTIRRLTPDPRLHVIEAGLFDRACQLPIYGAGTLAGSVFADHADVGGEAEMCDFLEASAFLRSHTQPGDRVYLKLNCEGSEAAILDNLIRSGTMPLVTACLVDFDVRKVPSQAHREWEIRDLLAQVPTCKVSFPEEVQYGQQSHYGGITNWLRVAGAIAWTPRRVFASARFHLGQIARREHLGYYKFQIMRRMPRPLASFYYRLRHH